MSATSQVAICAVLMSFCGSLKAQSSSSPRWVVGAGGGVILRTENGSSLGGNLRLSRVFQPVTSLFLEAGVTGHGFTRSDQSVDVCPPGGCPPIRHDGISLLGLELGGTFRTEQAANPVQPLVTLGWYRSASEDSSLIRFGASAGLLIPFSRSGLGPGLEVRYFRLFGDPRFKSLIPISLRWSF
jgi:hypothetical protein